MYQSTVLSAIFRTIEIISYRNFAFSTHGAEAMLSQRYECCDKHHFVRTYVNMSVASFAKETKEVLKTMDVETKRMNTRFPL